MSTKKLPAEEHPLNLVDAPKSSQEQYYKYMLRKERLNGIKDLNILDSDEVKSLAGVSEKERLLLKTLSRLYDLADTSPEFLQVKAVVGGGDREEIAEKLVEKFMEQEIVKDITDRFVAPTSGRAVLKDSLDKSRRKYDAFGNSK